MVAMTTFRPAPCRTTAAWAMIGVGTVGAVAATTFAYAEAVKTPSTDTTAYSADTGMPMDRPLAPPTTSTSRAPSYSPNIHTRSRGS